MTTQKYQSFYHRRPAEALPLAQAALQIYERLRHKDLEKARRLVARLQP